MLRARASPGAGSRFERAESTATASVSCRACVEAVPTRCVRSYTGFRPAVPSAALRISFPATLAQLKRRGKIWARQTPTPVVAGVFEKFTERAIKSVMLAQQEGKQLGCTEVCTGHILLGLIAELASDKGGYFGTAVTLARARDMVHQLYGNKRRAEATNTFTADLPFSLDAKRTFEAALKEANALSQNFISPEHLLVALLSAGETIGKQALERMGVDATSLKAQAMRKMKGEAKDEAQKRKSVDKAAGAHEKALGEFCRDLTAAARQGKIDPVIGRAREVARVMQILARRTKNNPVLLGEPGVGKTAIAEGLAVAIAAGASPDGSPLPAFLRDARILAVDVAGLVAGARERGELEARATRLVAAASATHGVILMIDEVHMLVGAGAGVRAAGSGLDIANLFKPALARGQLQVIGATTLDEHRQYIEKDAALERRFQPVLVAEPSPSETLAILEGLKERYEAHHRCVYDEGCLAAAVLLSSSYVADRRLPDKALDLIDEAGSRARIAAHAARITQRAAGLNSAARLSSGAGLGKGGGKVRVAEAPAAAWRGLQETLDAKAAAAREGLFEEAALLRATELELKARLVGPPGEAPPIPYVSVADVEAVVAAWTGIPVERLGVDEAQRVLRLPAALQAHVVGQHEAVAAVASAVARARSGLRDARRPVASLLFAGPTGVGKTELTKALAQQWYGDSSAMVRLDMSEFMERHAAARLVGAPPGYVGYGEGGRLTEAVRRRPHSIVLLDEVEKAHPDVFNLLLQVLEDGRLSDSQGRMVSFRHALIVMTSNLGSAVIAQGARAVGFELPSVDAGAQRYERVKALVMEELKGYFRPELLNRLDEVVVFRALGRPELAAIADTALAETAARLLAARGLRLELAPSLVARICEDGYDEAYGARPLRRALMRLVDDPLADAILAGTISEGDTVRLDVDPATGAVRVTAARSTVGVPPPGALRSGIVSAPGVLARVPAPAPAPPVNAAA